MTKHLKVLCVEDEENARQANQKLFSYFFNEVTCAKDGEEAWQLWQQKEYDLLITDLTMPKMDGVELIKQIKEKDPYAHVIVLTAHNDKEGLIDSINLHVDGFLLKPLDLQNFSHLLAKVAYEIDIKKRLESYQCKLQELQKEYNQISSDFLQEEIALARFEAFVLQHKKRFVALLLVINNLADLVDYFGVEVYEKILYKLKEILKKQSSFNFFQLRSNEFVFLAPLESEEELKSFGQNMGSLCVEIDDALFRIRFSQGWVEGEGEQLLKDIEKVLLHISQSGEIIVSSPQKNEDFTLLRKVSRLIKTNSIDYALQPIVDKNFEPIGYEALCRIKCINIGCQKVVEIAKIAGILHKVTMETLSKAFEKEKNLFINVSKEELSCEEFCRYIDTFPPIVLEFSPLLLLDRKAKAKLAHFKQKGHKLCFSNIGKDPYSILDLIDDNFTPDFIKFDLHIVKNALTVTLYHQLLLYYSAFVKTLGIKTIALGVENKELFEMLRSSDIDYFQGYYTGGPR